MQALWLCHARGQMLVLRPAQVGRVGQVRRGSGRLPVRALRRRWTVNEPKPGTLDLGDGFSARYYVWSPDRDLNPQYEGIPDQDRAGLILTCPHGEAGVPFAGRVPGGGQGWRVLSEDPLTLEPSILPPDCGCHGFIREGRWISA